MRYGYFDDKTKEYVITRPDTPRSWTNYLGDAEFGSVITNNAGGYTFYKSSAQGRIFRARLNTIPMDQPGRYIYVRDNDNSDYWSATWQPVGKPLDKYKAVCRFGTAYSIMESEYSRINVETVYFVPKGKLYEIWKVKVTNTGTEPRNLSLFTFVEYPGNWNAADDMINLQYTQYTLKMDVIDGIIDHGTNVYMPPDPDNFENKDQGRHTFMAVAGIETSGFDTDREKFIGPYRTYANPQVVEKGKCTNSIAVGDNGCGTHQSDITLMPGESRTFAVITGIGKADIEGKAARERYSTVSNVDKELEELKNFWHSKLEGFTVNTPDEAFNSMMNTWNPYNNLITFYLSRIASLVYNGERDGLGYRDTVQDMMGIMHSIPDEAEKRLELVISGQCSTGGALPVVKPFAHKPGKEKCPSEKEYRSDDCLWLFPAVQLFVKETGKTDFLSRTIPYADKGEDTVTGHLKRAILFSMERTGNNGFSCGLSADWNDCLQLGHDGESIFVAFQLRLAFVIYAEICRISNLPVEVEWAEKELKILDERLEKTAWDGDWYLRAIRADGLKFGSAENEEGKIFLNSQTWSIISGHASPERAQKAMKAVNIHLTTEYGLQVCDPPFEKTDFSIVKAILMNKGMKENAGIFNHIQGWAVMAETMLGHGNLAYDYYKRFMPASFNDKAEIREVEPYVHCQSTHSKYSPRYGNGRVSWLSGTATWAYYSAAHYILGIRPDYHGLLIDPCVPDNWQDFSVSRKFRGKRLDIIFKNRTKGKGEIDITVNGEKIEGNLIPVEILRPRNSIEVIIQ
jgi:cellobiose phosphorylase